MPQLSFHWPLRESYAAEDFIVSACNETAAMFLDRWPDGNTFAVLLAGPRGSGKTHLALRWRERTGARRLDASYLGTAPSAALWGNAPALLLEDIHVNTNERALFHLLRHGELLRAPLLMTSQLPAKRLPFRLADLSSRLLAAPELVISPPDDALLSAWFLKCFADRQWRVEPEVANYLVTRMERSFERANKILYDIDKIVSESKRDITVPLVRSLVEE